MIDDFYYLTNQENADAEYSRGRTFCNNGK